MLYVITVMSIVLKYIPSLKNPHLEVPLLGTYRGRCDLGEANLVSGEWSLEFGCWCGADVAGEWCLAVDCCCATGACLISYGMLVSWWGAFRDHLSNKCV